MATELNVLNQKKVKNESGQESRIRSKEGAQEASTNAEVGGTMREMALCFRMAVDT